MQFLPIAFASNVSFECSLTQIGREARSGPRPPSLTSALIATPNVAFGEGAKMKDWLERGKEDISEGAIIGARSEVGGFRSRSQRSDCFLSERPRERGMGLQSERRRFASRAEGEGGRGERDAMVEMARVAMMDRWIDGRRLWEGGMQARP